MASPQKENGYTRIANELIEQLASRDLSGRELRLLLVVMRKTWGWGKRRDRISLGQITKLTGIGRQHVATVVGRLVERQYVKRFLPGSERGMRAYEIQKDYDLWDTPLSPGYALVDKGAPESGSTPSRIREQQRGGTCSRKREQQKKETIQKGRGLKKMKAGPKTQGEDSMQHIGALLKKRKH